jgi:hypothetical protein
MPSGKAPGRWSTEEEVLDMRRKIERKKVLGGGEKSSAEKRRQGARN